ncbi:hypothetical protein AUEXF2481DRAFT_4537 [Aureobasidium subglaciale EXF-2481]|uniref:BTB domain-containing protein n=1 Tax=Aureobasidium subglaciale (strain EXF-2481) TaxID=1043005 RepID=A0A074YCT2_AURSE|nr:uncharacterized protein AUEXF2481DRAFT_4537 [Aureobasidium subglaciale EXF-2481]KAI5195716.1 hypothetical protein E4T38_08917 [Aureobasidium subglaciale]KAI5217571.1 hypothetical protein E4T41_08784 [Aureobasidium subglaciale]KEQ95560.1 hypothetical protein AUEXF2481DRAFT_4537 [Aureobasidium subglaciale EXF-2481]
MDPSIAKGVGLLSASAIRSLKAACSFSEVEPEERVVLMSPSLPLITVHVTSGLRGHGAMDFGIHQNILEHCSPFFKALLTADSAPSLIKNEDEPVVPQSPKVNAVICLEADPAAFKLYTEWVYSGHLVSETIRIQDTRLDALGQAYLLGEKLLDCEFKNAVVDAILNQIIVEGRVDLTLPNLIFDKPCHTSPLRKLLVDLHVWYGHKDWLKRDTSEAPISARFTADLPAALLDRHGHDQARRDQVPVISTCKYHEHPNGLLCPKNRKPRHPRQLLTSL